MLPVHSFLYLYHLGKLLALPLEKMPVLLTSSCLCCLQMDACFAYLHCLLLQPDSPTILAALPMIHFVLPVQSYRCYQGQAAWVAHDLLQGDIEFLVAETPDGKLDLKDTFVFDGGECPEEEASALWAYSKAPGSACACISENWSACTTSRTPAVIPEIYLHHPSLRKHFGHRGTLADLPHT